MAFKMKGSAFKLGNVASKSALKQSSPVKNAGVDEFPKELGLSPGARGKAVKNHDEVYGTGHKDHPGGQNPTPEELANSPKKHSALKQTTTKTKTEAPAPATAHPSGASPKQVAAYLEAGMKWYAGRGKWMYPEGN